MIAATHSAPGTSLFMILGSIFMFLVFSFPIWLPIVCGVIGTVTERRHYQSIHERERASAGMAIVPTQTSDDTRAVASARMVTGAVVVSPDSFRRFLSSIRKIFGGRLRAYESLLDRARREAILRMKAQAPDADAIVNLRVETTRIGGVQDRKGIIAVEVLAYGTALTYGHAPSGPAPAPPPLA
jgi:uncharacterized protein YbjQ (UPF0145 family)